MNLSALFIQRPIGTTLLALGLALAGLVAFIFLPVSALPEMDFPTISVQANFPGASPEIMASSVATPLERQLAWIAGLNQMTSMSTQGYTQVILQFDLSRNIDGAARDIQAAINAARSKLPPNLPSNPSYRKINPADSPILVMALSSDKLETGKIYDIATSILQQKLAQIRGVGQVFVGGSSLPAVRILVNPLALENMGLSLTRLSQRLIEMNVNRPKGVMTVGNQNTVIHANDQLFTARDYEPRIIHYQSGRALRLRDVASVIDSVENNRNLGVANNRDAVLLVLFKQPGANVVATLKRVQQALPLLRASIDPSLDLKIVMDRTNTIQASLHDVELTLLIALGLVVVVTYLFMGNVRAMLIPGVAVLLSLLGTFAVMWFLNYSLDNFSLMALTIGTGFVIDDAIVVLENISRHIESGMKSFEAALLGAKEVGFTVISMSLSLIAVFTPILLMGGLIGRIFREFAVTLSIAIFVSLIISLTLTPMMCAFLLRKEQFKSSYTDSRHHRYIEKLHQNYEKSLTWSVKHASRMILITALAFILSIILFIQIPKGFFPQQDTGRIAATMQVDQNSSFFTVKEKLRSYIKMIKEDKSVENVMGYIGNSTANAGVIYIDLKPLSKRKESVDQVIARLREKLKKMTGASLYMQAAQDIVIGGRMSNAQFQFTLSSNDLEDLAYWTNKVIKAIKPIRGITDVSSDQLNRGLKSDLNLDRSAIIRYGLTVEQLDQTLYSAFGQRQVSTFYTPLNQYHVVLEAAAPFTEQPSLLKQMKIINPVGEAIPFASFSTLSLKNGLLSVNHQSQSPSSTISFNLLPGYALGEAVKSVEKQVEQLHLPPEVSADFQGAAQAFKDSLSSEPYLILMAIISIYIVLGILYENLIHPITILSTIPSAGVGAFLALMFCQIEFSVIALIGLILLIGIVKKNAIMMIDFALQFERSDQGASPEKAILRAAVLRFRPIMMTSLAAGLGALPLALGHGMGSEFRRPLGVVIIGGIILSQLLTLYTTPVIYLKLDKLARRFQKQGNKAI